MKKIIRLSMILTVLFILFNQCKKDKLEITEENDNPFVPVTNYLSLNDFYNTNGAQIQKFTIDPSVPNKIKGIKGIELNIPANSFTDKNNQLPDSTIIIEIKELLTYNDMIISKKPTTSNGNILVSGGQVFIKPSYKGEVLKLNNYITISYPANNPTWGMEVFYGVENDSTGINWIPTQDSSLVFPDSSKYNMYIDSLGFGWINCDYFYNLQNSTQITITPVFETTKQDSIILDVYIVFKSLNSVMYSYIVNNEYISDYIPEGMEVVVVGIGLGKKSKQLYFGKYTTIVTANQKVNLTINDIKETDLINELKNL